MPNTNSTLADALTSAAQKATGYKASSQKLTVFSSSFGAGSKNTVAAMGSDGMSRFANRQLERTAFSGGYDYMGGGNTSFSAPGFYRPQLTPTAFNTVTQRKEVYAQVDWWLKNEPIVAAAIQFYSKFPFSGWKLKCSTAYVKEYFEKLVSKLDLQKWLPLIAKEYYGRGDCFAYASIECPICKGSMVDPKTGQPCQHDGATWRSLYVFDPASIEISNRFLDLEPEYYMRPTTEMIRIVQEQHPKSHYNMIPQELKRMILSGTVIPLDNMALHHFKHDPNPWEPFGTSLIRPLFTALMYKDRLRQAQWLVAERHILPLKIAKLGSDNRYAGEEDLEAIQEELTAVANDPLLTLVVPHDFEFDFVGASGKVLQITEELKMIEEEIINGLMLNKAILSGEGPNVQAAQIGLLVTQKRLEEFRNMIKKWIEEKIFKPVAMWNGFYEEDEAGTTKYIYPEIEFDDLSLKDNSAKMQTMIQAVTANMLPVQTLAEIMDLDWDEQVERMRYEQSMQLGNQVDFNSMEMDMGMGFRGPMGTDMSGGAAMQAGMPPLQPDMYQQQPQMPMAKVNVRPILARTNDQINRTAQTLAAHICHANDYDTEFDNPVELSYQEIRRMLEAESKEAFKNPRYSAHTVRIKSAAHQQFLNTRKPVTGLGYGYTFSFNADPPVNQEILTWEFSNGYPLNRKAIYHTLYESKEVTNEQGHKEVVAQRKSSPQLRREFFTKLEQQLYNIILSANIPYAFYAQFSVGSYKLDGAFPALRLAIEADSESYHSHQDQINRDKQRDMQLMKHGWTVLRFTEEEIREKEREVVHTIQNIVKKLVGSQSAISL